MSNESIRVFHYQEGSSDKIWAICTTKNQTSTYTVWFGGCGTKLTSKEVPDDQSPDFRMNVKLRKGYVELPDMTVDTESNTLMETKLSSELNVIPSALWYRLKASQLVEVQNRLDVIESELAVHSASEVPVLRSLSLYKDIKRGKLRGSHELEEGPLGVLLLFAFQRFCNSEFSEPMLEVSDDFNNLLPVRFNELSDYIADSCAAYLIRKGHMSDVEMRLLGNSHMLDVAKDQGVEHYSSIKAIKQLAIAVGCIDVPIDLSAIRPDQKSAFF